MQSNITEAHARTLEFEFVKGHIAATMTLIHGLIDQGVIDREHLDNFFGDFVNGLPQSRETFGLRLIIEQWREGLRDGASKEELKVSLYEVINGCRMN